MALGSPSLLAPLFDVKETTITLSSGSQLPVSLCGNDSNRVSIVFWLISNAYVFITSNAAGVIPRGVILTPTFPKFELAFRIQGATVTREFYGISGPGDPIVTILETRYTPKR